MDKLTCTSLIIVIEKKIHSNYAPSCVRFFLQKSTQEGAWLASIILQILLLDFIVHSNTFKAFDRVVAIVLKYKVL